jgi:hypothetical protein
MDALNHPWLQDEVQEKQVDGGILIESVRILFQNAMCD